MTHLFFWATSINSYKLHLTFFFQWDPDTQYGSNRPVLMVEGGYENFLLMYPMMVTDPTFTKLQETHPEINLDDIEYESVHDIKMKPDINRNTKQFAIQRYDSKSHGTLIKEKEEFMEESLLSEKEAYKKEAALMEIIQQTDSNADAETKKKVLEKQQELAYELLQLEDGRLDNENRIRQINEELEMSQMDQTEVEDLSATLRLQETERRKKEIENQRKQLQEANRRKIEQAQQEAERQRKLQLAREERLYKEHRAREQAAEAERRRVYFWIFFYLFLFILILFPIKIRFILFKTGGGGGTIESCQTSIRPEY